MTVDLSHLLRKPTGTAKRPPALPSGTYPGIVKNYEYISKIFGKDMPGVRFQLGATDWPEVVGQDEREGVDLSKRQLNKDFSIAEEDIWMLEAFLTSCGLADGQSTNEENVPKAIGSPILIEVKQYVNQRTSEIGNQVGKIAGQS